MKNLFAFSLGFREFRYSVTTHHEDDGQRHAYDLGRELAHKLTFRWFELY